MQTQRSTYVDIRATYVVQTYLPLVRNFYPYAEQQPLRRGKSNQYWSPIEAVRISMSNQYYSTSRPVLVNSWTSTGRNHPSAQNYTTSTYRGSIPLAYVRCARTLFYSGRTTHAPLTLSYRCSRSTTARSAGFSREIEPRFSASYHGCLLQMS